MIDNLSIVNNHPQMMQYIDYLQHKNAESLSFYPLCVFEREVIKNRLFLALFNNQPCGYLYIGAFALDLKIHQVCIQYDLRRKLYGAELISVVETRAIQKSCRTITLRCGFDIDANGFWNSLSYKCIAIVNGGVRRQRKINVWRKFLSPSLGMEDILIPAVGKTNASLWSKTHDKNNKQSQFTRGKRLQEYSNKLTNEFELTEKQEREV